MIPVLAGTSLAFEYTAYDGTATLSVAMKIYDVTTGSPSFVNTIAMTHMINGTYVGYFTPLAGKIYAINKMVYTDGTFATPSSLYSPGSETIQASTEQTQITAIQGTLTTMSGQLTSVQGDTSTLVSRLTAGRASNLDNLDATVSSRATQASVDAIQNNTNFVGIVPATLLIPDTGSTLYVFYANLYDEVGSPVDPDGGILQVTITTAGGGIVVPTTPMTHDGLGRYHFNYSVTSIDTPQPLTVIFTYSYLSVPFTQLRVTQTSEYQSSLDTLLSRLTATRAANLDNLDTTISSRASAAAISAIQAVLNQFHFNGNNVLAETVINDDKSGYSLSPGFVATIVSAVWDELLSSHTLAGTMGYAQNLLGGISSNVLSLRSDYTTVRAAKLDNLDAAVSTRADFASVSAVGTQVSNVQTSVNNVNSKLGTPVGASVSADIAAVKADTSAINAKTTNLPSDPASESAVEAAIAAATGSLPTIGVEVAAIKAKTDNLPVDPASESSVVAIPTNPLLTTDTRLNHLDANISSRATPADLSPLSTASQVSASTSAILTAIAGVDADLAPLATTAQLTAATAPLAQQSTLLNVESEVLAISGSQITPADVWTYTPRSLDVPVDTTIDLTPIAKTTDVTTAEANIISAIPQFDCQMATAIDPATDTITFQVWLEQANSVVISPQTAEINVYNSAGNPVISGLTSSSPSSVGVFTLSQINASNTLAANQAYTVTVTITQGVNTYETTKAFTVF